MRKSVKRIVLRRETLLELEKAEMPSVLGGGATNPPICDFSNRNTCTTCNLTCNTNLC